MGLGGTLWDSLVDLLRWFSHKLLEKIKYIDNSISLIDKGLALAADATVALEPQPVAVLPLDSLDQLMLWFPLTEASGTCRQER